MSASDRSTLRLSFARLARRTLGLGAYTFGAVTGVTHARFIGLRSAAERALARGNDADADVLAKELLDLAELYRNDWYYGNAIHHGNIIRGRVALRSGDVEAAREFQLAAGKTPGSPQLNSFGPNMQLADEFLAVGVREPVLEYFEACKSFWSMGRVAAAGGPRSATDVLDGWAAEVRAGNRPDFGANLAYQTISDARLQSNQRLQLTLPPFGAGPLAVLRGELVLGGEIVPTSFVRMTPALRWGTAETHSR